MSAIGPTPDSCRRRAAQAVCDPTRGTALSGKVARLLDGACGLHPGAKRPRYGFGYVSGRMVVFGTCNKLMRMTAVARSFAALLVLALSASLFSDMRRHVQHDASHVFAGMASAPGDAMPTTGDLHQMNAGIEQNTGAPDWHIKFAPSCCDCCGVSCFSLMCPDAVFFSMPPLPYQPPRHIEHAVAPGSVASLDRPPIILL